MQIRSLTFTMSTLFAAVVTRSVTAFTHTVAKHAGRSTPFVSTSLMARSMATGPMPLEDAKMPFYALGANLAMQVGGQGNLRTILDDDELEIVLQGFCENLRGTNVQDARTVLTTYGPQLNKILNQRTENIVERVKKDGADFIANFLDCNDEAIQTPSGLVYYSMKEGNGKKPSLSNTVEVHYHGTLTDGTVFDSSVDRGQTISFPLGGVIKGWQEGLAMMKEGGKATLVIPSHLAYGDGGSGDTIPPGATLKFEVELFRVS